MDDPNTIVIVGGKDGNEAKLETRLNPTRLDSNKGIALTSIYHGEILNIHDDNNTVHFSVEVFYGKMHDYIKSTAGRPLTTQVYSFKRDKFAVSDLNSHRILTLYSKNSTHLEERW